MSNRPTPTALRKLSGSNLNRLNKKESVFRSVETAHPPRYVERDAAAKEEWDRVIPELIANGLLTKANLTLFAAYCCAYASWMHAEDDVFENGRWISEPVFSKDGREIGTKRKPNSAIVQAQHACAAMRLFAIEFGLTPSSQTKVMADPSGERGGGSFNDFIEDQDAEDGVKVN